jgi:hypothetical protein
MGGVVVPPADLAWLTPANNVAGIGFASSSLWTVVRISSRSGGRDMFFQLHGTLPFSIRIMPSQEIRRNRSRSWERQEVCERPDERIINEKLPRSHYRRAAGVGIPDPTHTVYTPATTIVMRVSQQSTAALINEVTCIRLVTSPETAPAS